MELDLSSHASRHRPRHAILHALAWNSAKQFFHTVGRDDLYTGLQTIMIRGENLTLVTQKPLLNAEIIQYRSSLLDAMNRQIVLCHGHVTRIILR